MASKRVFLWIGLAVFVSLVITLWLVNPIEAAWLPKCPFKLATGLDCPSCGATRAAHAILHGNFREALAYNYFLVISVGYAAVVTLVYAVPRLHGSKLRRVAFGQTAGIVYAILFVLWWILRNIPAVKEIL